MTYKLWVNDARTVLIELWEDGTCTVALRETTAHTWGPPITMTAEKVAA